MKIQISTWKKKAGMTLLECFPAWLLSAPPQPLAAAPPLLVSALTGPLSSFGPGFLQTICSTGGSIRNATVVLKELKL